METNFGNDTKDYKAISESIQGLKTLKEKLKYYNDNYKILIVTSDVLSYHKINIPQYDKVNIYCTCTDCKDLYSANDFKVYRDFINNQNDEITKYFKNETDYKAKLKYYYKLNNDYPRKSTLSLKYIPNTIDEVKAYNNSKETLIDVTPQNTFEFDILLKFIKNKINTSNKSNRKRTPIVKGTELFNPSLFVYENRVDEINNYLELIVDETERKDLIKKYLDSINLDKIDIEKINLKLIHTHSVYNLNILKIVNQIIQKKDFENIIDKTNFKEVENYLFATETINFKKYLNSLVVPIPQQTEKPKIDLVEHIINQKDKDGFPINSDGTQISLMDIDRNIFIPLQSNFLISVKENSFIKFNPNNKLEVSQSLDTLVNYLTNKFYEYIEGYFLIDLSDEVKQQRNVRTEEPLKVLKIQMYFGWVTKWLNYIGNVFNFEYKLLFYSKYKEKIKNDLLSLETGLKEIKAPKSHIDFALRWIEETDKNIELETKSKEKKFAKNEITEPKPQNEKSLKVEVIEPEKISLEHNHIFKNNSFSIWQSMFNDFKIVESSRTDIKFMYEIMKYEKLIHTTVKQTDLLNWINETYQLSISKARYIDFKNDTKRMAIFIKAKTN